MALSRYVTAVASGKLYDYKLMNKIVDASGNVVESYSANYTDISGYTKWYTVGCNTHRNADGM